MPIFKKLKAYLSLFHNLQKNQVDESENYMEKFERLHRNGMSDEEWEAKKREHPGLFSEPSFNHVGKTHKESRISEILGRNGLSDENGKLKSVSILVCLVSLVLIMLVRLMRRVGFLRF